MNRILTFQIDEDRLHELRGGRIAFVKSDGDEITVEWRYPLPNATMRKVILCGKVTDSDPRDLAHWWDSEEGRQRREDAKARFEAFKKSRGL